MSPRVLTRSWQFTRAAGAARREGVAIRNFVNGSVYGRSVKCGLPSSPALAGRAIFRKGRRMSVLTEIDTTDAPAALGPYSQAIVLDSLVFASGSLPVYPGTKTMPGDVRVQAVQALSNIQAILEAAGSGMDKVVKATIFLVDMDDFAAVNEVYGSFFARPFPARSCFAVAALPLGAKVEIEVVATK